MNHWTGYGLLNGVTYEGVWVIGTDRLPANRAAGDETQRANTARRRLRFVPRRTHARPV